MSSPIKYKIEVPVPNHVHDTSRSLSSFIDLVVKYKDNIDSLYFPLGHVARGVDVWGIRAPGWVYSTEGEVNIDSVFAWEGALKEIVSYVDLPITVLMNNTYNPAFYDPGQMRLIKSKVDYYIQNFRVKSFTIADFSLIPHLLSWGQKISLSTNSHNSFAELDMALSVYGPDTFESIVVQRDLNRNPQKLKSYFEKRGLMDRVVLMVNEGCVNACPFKASGDVEISVSDITSTGNKIHTAGCTLLNREDLAWTFLTSPFMTHDMVNTTYPDIKTIKLAGRNLPVSNLKRQLDHWITGTPYKLSEVLNVSTVSEITTADLEQDKNYVRNVMTCNKECFICRKCETTYNSFFSKHPSIKLMLASTQKDITSANL